MGRRTGMLVVLLVAVLSAPPLRAGEGQGAVQVSGRFLYEDKAWDFDGWTGDDPLLPVRHADVTILDAATHKVLGRGSTDEDGAFSVSCLAWLPATVVARVDTDNRVWAKATPLMPRLLVQSPSKERYAAFSPSVSLAAGSDAVDLGTTTALKLAVNDREGNPFNVFDVSLRALEYVVGPTMGATRRVRGVRVVWPNMLGSYTTGRRAWIATDDGYDDSVILHEVGHVVHNLYSDSDNPGGLHYFGDSDQDPRLAFGEGLATAFAGMVLDDLGQEALYVDALAATQEGHAQLGLRLESSEPFFDLVQGASDEVAVACVLFDIVDGVDAGAEDGGGGIADDDELAPDMAVGELPVGQAWWDVFTGPVRKARRLTMNHFWDGWLEVCGPDPRYEELQQIFESRRLRNWPDAAEPDDDPAAATPLLAGDGTSWVTGRTLYRAPPAEQPAPGTGDRDWYAVPLEQGWHVVIETRYPGGLYDAATQADPHLTLFDPSGKRRAVADDGGAGRNARLELVVPESGTWRFMVRSRNKVHRYGRYELQVRRLDG